MIIHPAAGDVVSPCPSSRIDTIQCRHDLLKRGGGVPLNHVAAVSQNLPAEHGALLREHEGDAADEASARSLPGSSLPVGLWLAKCGYVPSGATQQDHLGEPMQR